MKVTKLQPSGFCFGVERSYAQALDIAKKHKGNNIYMIGWLVHNRLVIQRLQDEGITIVDDSHANRYEIIKSLPPAHSGDVIIFSAHGTRYDAIELAKSLNFIVYDLTCPYVYKTHKLIQQKLNKDYDVYFIGKQGHPETNAVLAIDEKVKLLDITKSLDELESINNNVFCTNQTTLSVNETKDYYEKLKHQFPQIEIANDICDATTQRQNAIKMMNNDIDVCFIIGDIKSSNANELLNLAKQKCDSYLISNKEDIDVNNLCYKKHIAIIGAASCPNDLIEDIAKYLEGL